MIDYWKSREILEREKLLNKSIKQTELDLVREYRRLSGRLSKQLESVYNKIITSENISINELYKYNRYYELLNNLNMELEKSGVRITAMYNRRFLALYKENSLLIGKQLGLNSEINIEQAEKVINAVWVNDGKNWSDRVWNNHKVLANKLEQGLIDSISAGYSPEVFKAELMKIFNVSYNNASTLARTELSHIYNQSALDKYREAGITHYRFLATPDERECSACQELNNKIFTLDEVKIPVHPQCRCVVLAVLDKENK